ncbi:AbrB/MazE/SpoVT family DNA-binding domain-containing protein [bacterium]|nr:AbrB/MazE/SpoVT family DNA-binding domain-containing protein [bacterium]
MMSVKVLPKYQITIPKVIREKMHLHLGDALVIEEEDKETMIIKKGKTIYDYIGSLPNLGISIEKIREKAIKEAMKDE